MQLNNIDIPTRVDPLTSILDAIARFFLRSYQDVSLSQDRIILRLKKFQDFKISIKSAENSYIRIIILFCRVFTRFLSLRRTE